MHAVHAAQHHSFHGVVGMRCAEPERDADAVADDDANAYPQQLDFGHCDCHAVCDSVNAAAGCVH